MQQYLRINGVIQTSCGFFCTWAISRRLLYLTMARRCGGSCLDITLPRGASRGQPDSDAVGALLTGDSYLAGLILRRRVDCHLRQGGVRKPAKGPRRAQGGAAFDPPHGVRRALLRVARGSLPSSSSLCPRRTGKKGSGRPGRPGRAAACGFRTRQRAGRNLGSGWNVARPAEFLFPEKPRTFLGLYLYPGRLPGRCAQLRPCTFEPRPGGRARSSVRQLGVQ